ncbi:MAG: hypothetical protein ABIK47_06595 [candidate division WOR-3 bacterium]
MRFLITVAMLILPVNGSPNERANRENIIWHVGVELSELMQNRFRNLGPDNLTFYCGQQTLFGYQPRLGWRLLLINVELSKEHLQSNRFISGDKGDLSGRLTVSRLYLDWYPLEKKLGFISFKPIVSAGLGYNRTVIKHNETYDFRTVSFGPGFRLQTEFFNSVFVEFPVIDGFVYLWKSGPARQGFSSWQIEYPEWGMAFLWVNLGVNFRF